MVARVFCCSLDIGPHSFSSLATFCIVFSDMVAKVFCPSLYICLHNLIDWQLLVSYCWRNWVVSFAPKITTCIGEMGDVFWYRLKLVVYFASKIAICMVKMGWYYSRGRGVFFVYSSTNSCYPSLRKCCFVLERWVDQVYV